MPRVGDRRDLLAQQRVELGVRVIGEVRDVLHAHIEVAALHAVVPELGLDLHVLGLDADAPPLVDGEDAGRREGLRDRAIEQLDFEVADARFLQ